MTGTESGASEPRASRRVVVGVDFSGDNALALEYAAVEADRRRVPLVLLHSVDAPTRPLTYLARTVQELVEAAREDLAGVAMRLGHEWPALPIDTEVATGSPAACLMAATADGDLAVLGSRGHGSAAELLLGSVAWQVTCRARGPVILVNADTDQAELARGAVLVGVDGSADSQHALRFACEEATLRDRRLVAAGVWTAPIGAGLSAGRQWSADQAEWVDQAVGDVDRALSESLAGVAEDFPDLKVERVVAHGVDIAATLLDIADRECAELIVLGAGAQHAVARLVLGAAAVRMAHCDGHAVAVVRSPAPSSPPESRPEGHPETQPRHQHSPEH